MKLVYQYMAIFFNFPPTSNHLHPLRVENCGSNSRLVVDGDDYSKFRLERGKITLVKCSMFAGLFHFRVALYCFVMPHTSVVQELNIFSLQMLVLFFISHNRSYRAHFEITNEIRCIMRTGCLNWYIFIPVLSPAESQARCWCSHFDDLF